MIFWTKRWGEMVKKTKSFGEFVISTNQQQPQAEKEWSTSSTLTLLFLSPYVKYMLAQTYRPGHPGERMTCHYLHWSCLSLWKPISFNMFGLRVQNNTNGLSEIWRNFQGGYLLHPSAALASPGPQGASHFTLFWCCINHRGWLWQRPVGDLMAGLCKMSHHDSGWTSWQRGHDFLSPEVYIKAINPRKSESYFWKPRSSVFIFVVVISYSVTNLNYYMSNCVLW